MTHPVAAQRVAEQQPLLAAVLAGLRQAAELPLALRAVPESFPLQV
jgi:hypothetical protein